MIEPGFVDRWARFSARWLQLEVSDPSAAGDLVRRALGSGLESLGELPVPATRPEGPDVRRCEIALVHRSGELDEAGYRLHNPKMAASGGDPVTNYCRSGWRNMRNPNLDFDGWWYRTEYLDPNDDSVNPFVHWLLDGRFRGLLPLPRPTTRPETRVGPGPVRRAALFAAYDPDGVVDDCVVAYLRELARFAEVFVLYDGHLQVGQLDRLDGLVAGAWEVPHATYDFGSWSILARDLVGWDALATYDEVLLVNDSCYLLRPLDEVFTRMSSLPGDFWGLQLTARLFEPGPDEPQALGAEEVRREWLPRSVFRYEEFAHVGSYFLALRRPAVADQGLRRRFDVIGPRRTRQMLVHEYETGTTQYLLGQGYSFSTFVPGLRPFHPIYGPGYFDLVAEGFPLLKRRFLVDNPFGTPGLARWRERVLAGAPEAPVDTFERNLRRVADAETLARSFAKPRRRST